MKHPTDFEPHDLGTGHIFWAGRLSETVVLSHALFDALWEEVVRGTVRLGFVETAQGVVVVKEFQKGIHLTALGLELLGHCYEDDFALVNSTEIEGALLSAKDFGDFRGEELLEVIDDGFPDTAKLFLGLVQKPVLEVG